MFFQIILCGIFIIFVFVAFLFLKYTKGLTNQDCILRDQRPPKYSFVAGRTAASIPSPDSETFLWSLWSEHRMVKGDCKGIPPQFWPKKFGLGIIGSFAQIDRIYLELFCLVICFNGLYH